MDGLTIYINWEYLLGVVGTLVALAYYANGRLTKIETSVEWLIETVRGLKIGSENASSRLFKAGSPISLTPAGQRILRLSGMKSYIDAHADQLLKHLPANRPSDTYEAQSRVFHLFATIELDASFGRHLNEFAFANGVSIDLLRRVAAIYFRDAAKTSA